MKLKKLIRYFFLFFLLINVVFISSVSASNIEELLEIKGYHKADYFDSLEKDSSSERNPQPRYIRMNLELGDNIDLIPVKLEANKSYVFVSSLPYTEDCYNIEMSILDNQGEVKTSSNASGKVNLIQFKPENVGMYYIMVSIPSHSRNAENCLYYLSEFY
jgi:hypothetical protein